MGLELDQLAVLDGDAGLVVVFLHRNDLTHHMKVTLREQGNAKKA
jgi:hypothetical protein